MSNRPIARLEFRAEKQTYSVLSIWRGKFAGGYDISRDKGTDKRPAISFGDAIRRWMTGDGYLAVWIESEREQRGGSSPQPPPSNGGDDFGDVPF